MKKYIISIIAAACAVSAYAKSTDELVAEYRALDSSENVRQARLDYVRENIADVRAAWQAEKGSPFVKLNYTASAEWAALSAEGKQAKNYMRSLFCQLYKIDGDIDAPSDVKLSLNWYMYIRGNSDAWANIKAGGYKINGSDVSEYLAFEIAVVMYDIDVAYKFRDELKRRSAAWLDGKCESVRRMCLYAEDVDKAKAVCNAYENAMLMRNCANTEQIQVVGKVLTARIVDAKISN